jgi:hypothetical protein
MSGEGRPRQPSHRGIATIGTITFVAALVAAHPACDPGAPQPDDHERLHEPFPGAWAPTGAPGQRNVYLRYADGAEVPTPVGVCSGSRPAVFSCAFADSRAACQAAVQLHLARWYQRFNVHFTVVAPPPGVPHDTVIISRDGDWCGPVPLGLAPVACEPLQNGVAWAFQCGDRDSAERCAAIIAQEHAHLIGLEHTNSPRDLMFNPFSPEVVGFEDRENPVVAGKCRALQNSFALMAERLRP